MRSLRLRVAVVGVAMLSALVRVDASDHAVSGVRFERAAFNPSAGERVRLQYDLAAAATITVKVFDPDGGLVAVPAERVAQEAGNREVIWDGRDLDGLIVPDEAYQVTIETSDGFTYDPMGSGGEVGDITTADFDTEAGTVVYRLPKSARVLIRCGVRNGPMLKTLVDWKPRIAGSITEYWDGRDEDKLVSARSLKDFRALITYVTLADATVIAFGNGGESYRDAKLGRWKERPQKAVPKTTAATPSGATIAANLVPPAWSRTPRVHVAIGETDSGAAIPELRGEATVRVDVDPMDRADLLRDQFEVIFFVDNIFFSEAERGYLPLTWHWELQQFPPGEHVLTVNISSVRGQVGVGSRRVRILEKVKP